MHDNPLEDQTDACVYAYNPLSTVFLQICSKKQSCTGA